MTILEKTQQQIETLRSEIQTKLDQETSEKLFELLELVEMKTRIEKNKEHQKL